jgi:TolB protein
MRSLRRGATVAAALLCLAAPVRPVAADDVPAPAWPAWPASVSADGQRVAFVVREAPAATSGAYVFLVRDRAAGRTLPLGFQLEGFGADTPRAALSADGRKVAVALSTVADPLVAQVVEIDLASGASTLVSANPAGRGGNAMSSAPSVSADGRYVAFTSVATDLLPGNGAVGAVPHAYVRDVLAGTTTEVTGPDGPLTARAEALSADGRHLVYADRSDLYERDLDTGASRPVGAAGSRTPEASVSADGRWVAFTSDAALLPADTNRAADVYVRDLVVGRAELVSVSGAGTPTPAGRSSGAPAISADGRWVAFESDAGNLAGPDPNGVPDVFLRDRRGGVTRLVSGGGDADSFGPVISGDGRYVGFGSLATTLVPGAPPPGPNAYLRDTRAHTLGLVNLDVP